MNRVLELAIAHHQSGRLGEAESGYRAVLEASPDQPDALHLLGVALFQQGRPVAALGAIDTAIERLPGVAAYHSSRGEVLRALGRIDEAADALSTSLGLDPHRPKTHNHMGLVHLSRREPRRALASFDEAIRLDPDFTTARVNRAEALRALDLYEGAAEEYRRVLAVEPANHWVHTYLAYTLVEGGDTDRLEEAAWHAERAVALAPDLAIAHVNLGNVRAAMRRLEEALACYRRAAGLDPTSALAWNNIGYTERELGRPGPARAALGESLRLDPRSALSRTNLASLLDDELRDDEAIDQFRIALGCDPSHVDAHIGLSRLLSRLGRSDEALATIEEAVRLRPRMPAAHIQLGHLLAQDGDFERSNACARAALSLRPPSPSAYHLLATNLRGRLPEDDLATMLAMRDAAYLSDAERSCLQFGIGAVLGARGRHDEAAAAFESGNRHQAAARARRGEGLDPVLDLEHLDRAMSSYSSEFFRAVLGRGRDSRRPIFVVGMPRSGTTLVEQVLASHPEVFGAGELMDVVRIARELMGDSPDFGRIPMALRELDPRASRALAGRYLDRLDELDPSARHVVDKMPGNYLHLGLIAALWPGSTIIACRRDPRDVGLSCWTTCFEQIRWANDLREIARQIIGHDRMMAHWEQVLPIPIIRVDYEAMVADFETQARRLLEAVGLAWDSACLAFHTLKRPVRTASLQQVRRPIYSSSVGRWRRYEAALAPLLEEFALHGHPLPEGSPRPEKPERRPGSPRPSTPARPGSSPAAVPSR